MTEEQKLRYELLMLNKGNIVEAQLAYNFIMGIKEEADKNINKKQIKVKMIKFTD